VLSPSKQHPDLLTMQVNAVFSIHPYEGISVLYDPTTTDEAMIQGFGVTAASQIRVCFPLQHPTSYVSCTITFVSRFAVGSCARGQPLLNALAIFQPTSVSRSWFGFWMLFRRSCGFKCLLCFVPSYSPDHYHLNEPAAPL